MVDEEVETTLREIRERVRRTAEPEAEATPASEASAASSSLTSAGQASTKPPETMARIDSYLTTTARAWDRLPPLVSKRSGGLARLELWVKQRFKQATRWYSWEQINFNAAVHHALRDTLDALLDLEQRLVQDRAEIEAHAQRLEQIHEQIQVETMTQRAEIESQRAALESQRAELDSYRALEVNARLADLSEREQQHLEEQRVCFKQLSLEMSEAEVLLDRARRDIESRLDKLEHSKSKS